MQKIWRENKIKGVRVGVRVKGVKCNKNRLWVVLMKLYKKSIDILYNIYYNFHKANKKIKNDF